MNASSDYVNTNQCTPWQRKKPAVDENEMVLNFIQKKNRAKQDSNVSNNSLEE